ncbi:carbohydrate-binding module family 63 protein [Karstenula rhodostoma CBS 690.94]|uniref:Carbohydrate-binding module family 63 protein n=1 Tax=Karstenula rhodostoma CBS 690.94 TaxID=1392251 RepID=A0A9P4UEH8_9PLEO|nr:carbohydrate-binding module family 63 protein [Karstenula rhodostoma CBS 690.94]
MKSFVAMLPFAGFAFAQGQCGPGIIVTETSIEKITVTVQPTSQIAIVTPNTENTENTKPSQTPQVPYYPIGNTTTNGPSAYPTHTPKAPTTLETLIYPSDVVSSSTSSKKVKTVYVVPSPVGASSSASQAAAAVTSSVYAAPAQPSQAAAATSSVLAAPAQPPQAAVPEPVAEEATSSAASVTGSASFYGGNLDGGACSFSGYTIPSNLFGTAFGGSWDASQCGTCVEVKNKAGKSIKAMVVDQCPECAVNKLDLFENGFTQIGTKTEGIIPITYTVVPCGITSPIVLKNKEGTSPYWFSMQVRNSNVAVSKLEVSTDGGATWQATQRSEYNFWENSAGYGTSTVDVKVTGVNGKTVTVKGVSVTPLSTKTAGGNF